jgi:hypothetical protein
MTLRTLYQLGVVVLFLSNGVVIALRGGKIITSSTPGERGRRLSIEEHPHPHIHHTGTEPPIALFTARGVGKHDPDVEMDDPDEHHKPEGGKHNKGKGKKVTKHKGETNSGNGEDYPPDSSDGGSSNGKDNKESGKMKQGGGHGKNGSIGDSTGKNGKQGGGKNGHGNDDPDSEYPEPDDPEDEDPADDDGKKSKQFVSKRLPRDYP